MPGPYVVFITQSGTGGALKTIFHSLEATDKFMGRLKDSSWQRWRKKTILNTGAEKILREAGIPVVDVKEFLRVHPDNPLHINYDAISDPIPVHPVPSKMDRTHPNWHDAPCRVFDDESFPVEGRHQAEIFTKSVQVKNGLPDDIVEFGNSVQIQDQDVLVRRIIQQAFFWDSYLEKLPNLRNFDYPSYTFRRQFGIPAKRSNEILMTNLIRLCETKFPKTAINRILTREEQFRVKLYRHESLVQLKLTPLMSILSKEFLNPIMNATGVKETENIELPSIYPFLSTANIDDVNIYDENDNFAFKSEQFPSIHTTVFSHHIPGSHTHIHPRWNDNRFTGSTIMYNFATALLLARQKYGSNVKKLPEPVTTQVIHFTGKEFQFGVFQLNTLDLDDVDKNSVKNIMWVTDKIPLFNSCTVTEIGEQTFEGYNPGVFKLLLGMYASGLNL